ncbi:MAG: DNA primase [Bacteroidales bacterium]|nr:DNA primase [Bacteroidales bacterium]
MISQETKQRILDATQIEEVIGDFVSLRKRGGNHIGCCPFHNEKTPSFYVSPSKGIFKCFGCGESGDAVSFLMKHEHYTYPEALRWLAQKYNITIEEEQLSEEQQQRRSERDALFHVSEFAEQFFVDSMMNTELGQAVGLGYYHKRGLSDEIIKRFGLGYSPDEWRAFTDHALKNGYSKEVLEKTGLTIVKEDGKMYDRFRGRVTFPIYSISGRVLGFSCRILSSEKQAAKYVNSPDSDIYNKSNILYGLFQAKNAISRLNKCYLVEGNLDVVSMHQSGVENTVASCGTSLTIEQIRLIKRYTPNVTIVYDSDAAGIKATQRAANLLFQEGMRVRCVLFPDGDDPDSYAQHNGSAALQQYLDEHEENYILYKARITSEQIKRDPIRKSEFIQDIADSIALVQNLIERSEYIQQCSSLFNVSEQSLSSLVAKTINRNRQHPSAGTQNDSSNSETQTSPNPEIPQSGNPKIHQPDLPSQGTCEAFERHLVDLLMRFGGEVVNWTYRPPDQEEDITKPLSVASIIISTLHSSGLSFENPLYQEIYTLALDALKQGKIISPSQFAASENPDIRELAISSMMQPYEVSDLWQSTKGIYVPDEIHRLPSDLSDTLHHFRLKKVELELAENSQRLKEESDPDQILLLVKRHTELINLKKVIAQKLRMVISGI